MSDPEDDSGCVCPGETDERGLSYCGRLDAECCAKARLRNFKAVDAIVDCFGDEPPQS